MSLLEDARAILAASPVCDACLGRVFADRSHGLRNDERGRALRVAVAMAGDEPFAPADPADCWVCEGLSAEYDDWADRVVAALDGGGSEDGGLEFATYQVGTRVPPLIAENDRLLREDAGLPEDAGELFKADFNREVGRRVGERTGADVDFERPDVVALLNLQRGDVDVQVNPAFVYGRYRKLERDVPQTEWPCRECGASGVQLADEGGEEPCDHCGGSGYLYDRSVEQLTAPPIVEAMAGDEGVFHGAGREDVDARMLGTGRPFVVEVKQPRRRFPDVSSLEDRVNEFADGAVEVEGLRLATHETVERVKEHPASKTYRMDVEFGEPVGQAALDEALETLTGTTVQQRTPERVDHRRASKVRERTVYDASGALSDDDGDVDDAGDVDAGDVDAGGDADADGDASGEPTASRRATVEVHGAGGLYVKELVSGDDGRTEPSLAGLLGVAAAVTALDVLAVEGEAEPFEDPDFFVEPPAADS